MFLFNNTTKWTSLLLSILLILNIYNHNPIRFSSKYIIDIDETIKLSYGHFYVILSIILIIQNTGYAYFLQTNYPLPYNFNFYWFLIIPVISLILLKRLYRKPVINDGSLNLPPKFLKKQKNSVYIITIIILLYNLIIEMPKFKSLNKIMKVTLIFSRFLPLNIIAYMLNQKINYSSCKYDIPTSWN